MSGGTADLWSPAVMEEIRVHQERIEAEYRLAQRMRRAAEKQLSLFVQEVTP